MALLGNIHSTESFGTVDGPGIRFIVFMQGCLMRCKYCHNRDTWDLGEGESISSDELLDKVLQYRHFFESSGGGVTASGGEAILQAEFLAELFSKLKANGLHTCLDTNGFVRKYTPAIDKLLESTDLVLLDIKHIDDEKHIDLTQVSNHRVLQFAKHLNTLGKKTWLRYVVVNGYTDCLAAAKKLADFIAPMDNIEKVEILPYHTLGKHKWETLGETYQLGEDATPSKERLELIKQIFIDAGKPASF